MIIDSCFPTALYWQQMGTFGIISRLSGKPFSILIPNHSSVFILKEENSTEGHQLSIDRFVSIICPVPFWLSFDRYAFNDWKLLLPVTVMVVAIWHWRRHFLWCRLNNENNRPLEQHFIRLISKLFTFSPPNCSAHLMFQCSPLAVEPTCPVDRYMQSAFNDGKPYIGRTALRW